MKGGEKTSCGDSESQIATQSSWVSLSESGRICYHSNESISTVAACYWRRADMSTFVMPLPLPSKRMGSGYSKNNVYTCSTDTARFNSYTWWFLDRDANLPVSSDGLFQQPWSFQLEGLCPRPIQTLPLNPAEGYAPDLRYYSHRIRILRFFNQK